VPTVSIRDLANKASAVVDEVAKSGKPAVVTKRGEPIAAVVPIDHYNQWKRSRADFFERMSQAAGRSNLTAEDADRLAAEAIAAVRAEPPPPC